MPCQTTIHSGRKIPLPQKVPPLPEIMFKFYDVDPASGSISEVWPKTSIGVSVSRLVRAALTVGRANWTHVLAHGGKSRLECIWRVAMLLANISRATKGSKSIYSRSEAFDTLDPSEKGAASYFIGGIATQVVAEWLGYSPLLHLDTYTKAVYSTTAITASFHPGPMGGRTLLDCGTMAGMASLNPKGERSHLIHSYAKLQKLKRKRSTRLTAPILSGDLHASHISAPLS
ncbi:hypothetical protein AKL17_1040 [Frigidibacter mobilis]|uniref:Uncharacterized protein n=1 Tax=Frigidibacter mobilis TaxID=1335048 RepID=A0A161HBR7_9RHOB|nr:hypothetical protein AKL17_1040 [Frigidibacter mobilis]